MVFANPFVSAQSAPALIYFNANVSATNIVQYAWNFTGGDTPDWGSNAPALVPFLFETGGLHKCILTVTDSNGDSTATEVDVTVGAPANPPAAPTVAKLYLDADGGADTGFSAGAGDTNLGAAPITVTIGTVVSVDVTSSTARTGASIASFLWDVNGDGVPNLVTPAVGGSATGTLPFPNPGSYTISVWAVDNGAGNPVKALESAAATFVVNVTAPTVDKRQIFWVQPDPQGVKGDTHGGQPNDRETYSGANVSLKVNAVPVGANPPTVKFLIRDMTAAGDIVGGAPNDPVADYPLNGSTWHSASDAGTIGAAYSVTTDSAPPYFVSLDTTKLVYGNWYELAAFIDANGNGSRDTGEPATTLDKNGAPAYSKRVFIQIAATSLVVQDSTHRQSPVDPDSDSVNSYGSSGKPLCDVTLPNDCLDLDPNLTGVNTYINNDTSLTQTKGVGTAPTTQTVSSAQTLNIITDSSCVIELYSNSQGKMKLKKPSRVRLYYTAATPDGKGGGQVSVGTTTMLETAIVIYHFNSKTSNWEPLPNQVITFAPASKTTAQGYVDADAVSYSPFALAGIAIAAAAGGGGAGGGAALGALAAVALCGTTGFDAIIALALVFWMSRYLRKRERKQI